MAKFVRQVVSFSNAAQAEARIGEFDNYNIVAVVGLDKRLVFIFEKEKTAGRPKKAEPQEE